MDRYEVIEHQQRAKVEALLKSVEGAEDKDVLHGLCDLLVKESTERIAGEEAFDRREKDYRKQLEQLRERLTLLETERREVVRILQEAGDYAPMSKEDEALPFWVSGVVFQAHKEEENRSA